MDLAKILIFCYCLITHNILFSQENCSPVLKIQERQNSGIGTEILSFHEFYAKTEKARRLIYYNEKSQNHYDSLLQELLVNYPEIFSLKDSCLVINTLEKRLSICSTPFDLDRNGSIFKVIDMTCSHAIIEQSVYEGGAIYSVQLETGATQRTGGRVHFFDECTQIFSYYWVYGEWDFDWVDIKTSSHYTSAYNLFEEIEDVYIGTDNFVYMAFYPNRTCQDNCHYIRMFPRKHE